MTPPVKDEPCISVSCPRCELTWSEPIDATPPVKDEGFDACDEDCLACRAAKECAADAEYARGYIHETFAMMDEQHQLLAQLRAELRNARRSTAPLTWGDEAMLAQTLRALRETAPGFAEIIDGALTVLRRRFTAPLDVRTEMELEAVREHGCKHHALLSAGTVCHDCFEALYQMIRSALMEGK